MCIATSLLYIHLKLHQWPQISVCLNQQNNSNMLDWKKRLGDIASLEVIGQHHCKNQIQKMTVLKK